MKGAETVYIEIHPRLKRAWPAKDVCIMVAKIYAEQVAKQALSDAAKRQEDHFRSSGLSEDANKILTDFIINTPIQLP